MEVIGLLLCGRWLFGLNGRKLHQEYVEDLLTEGKSRGWSMFSFYEQLGRALLDWRVVRRIEDCSTSS